MSEIVWTESPGYDASPSLESWRKEIGQYYQIMKVLVDEDPREAFQHLSQFSARASEMRSNIAIQEGRREAAFRLKIIDPFLDECDRQFRVLSRIHAIRQMEWDMARGT